MLAKLWGVSPIDVLVAAGHLDPEDAQMKEPPQPPRPNPDPHLARLAALLDSDAPEDVKARIRAMLTAAADLGELSSSAERPTGRSA